METRGPIPSDPSTKVDDRRCGRCQRPYPGDPTLASQTEWGLCPACSPVLLPASTRAAAGRRSAADTTTAGASRPDAPAGP